MGQNSDIYLENGLTVMNGVIDKKYIVNLRDEIVDVINEASDEKVNYDGSKDSFMKETTKSLWNIVNEDPNKRNLIYKYIQRVPALYQLANLDVLRDFAKDIGMKKPSVREIKVQMYLPWEKLFFQCCHQDINSLDSQNSVTFWFPLHYVAEHAAVSYHKYSHKEGPVVHEERIDEEFGIYGACVPKELQEKYPEIEKAVVDEGDLIALNRMVFHTSPKFEDQKYARWTVLVRYDDIEGNGMYDGTTKYEKYTPFNLQRYNNEILPKIREYLTQKPKIKWSPDE
ncbi:MAG: phytanoyl-CoA dioxygenase family protein [Campylobacterales bacterium]|nr:phytanoyl-CoA dioxygenase family protein [Campylobacterales bacterium]